MPRIPHPGFLAREAFGVPTNRPLEIGSETGRHTVEQDKDSGTATYDNIDLTKGSARIIANAGASDLMAWMDHQGSLWLLERAPSGNEVITTVYPMYAEGTNEFVVLESRHTFTGPIAVGSNAYGTCKVWQ